MWGRLTFLLVALVVARPVFADEPARPAAQPAPAGEVTPPADDSAPDSPEVRLPQGPDTPLAPGADDDALYDTVLVPHGAPDAPLHEDDEFGPVISIERVDILGNTATQTEIIRRALPIGPGDVLHSSDKRLRDARFKLLALGFFRDVSLAVQKGSQRGRVVLEVRVVERGTLVLNQLWFGTTALTPWWLGADVTERNLHGFGVGIGGGVIFARHGDFAGTRDQWAGELRLSVPAVGGSRWGASAAATVVHGSEPFRDCHTRVTGTEPGCAFGYRRIGARLGATYNLSTLTRVTTGLRVEQIDTDQPAAPTASLSDGTPIAVDLHLDPRTSHVVTASIRFDRDTRPDPILPYAGSLIVVSAELGGTLLGGSYDYATLFGRYEHYWRGLRDHHAIAIKLIGGVVVGDAPRFDRIHVADVDRMLTPRALGLVLSTAAPLALLGTRADKPTYGDLGGSATAEYVFQLFRGSGTRHVYGGDVFVGAGLWGLAERADLRARDASLVDSLPIDLYLDAGLRIDTHVGVFELTIANALGRLR